MNSLLNSLYALLYISLVFVPCWNCQHKYIVSYRSLVRGILCSRSRHQVRSTYMLFNFVCEYYSSHWGWYNLDVILWKENILAVHSYVLCRDKTWKVKFKGYVVKTGSLLYRMYLYMNITVPQEYYFLTLLHISIAKYMTIFKYINITIASMYQCDGHQPTYILYRKRNCTISTIHTEIYCYKALTRNIEPTLPEIRDIFMERDNTITKPPECVCMECSMP